MGVTGAAWRLVQGPGSREQWCPRRRQGKPGMLLCPGPGVRDQQDSAAEFPDRGAGRAIRSQALWEQLQLHSSMQNHFLLSRQVIPAVCG